MADQRCRDAVGELEFFMAARITEERWISRMATDAGRAMQKHFNAKTPRNKVARVRSCGWPGDGSQGLGNSGDHWIRWLFTASTSRHGALAFSFVCMIAADGVVAEPETYRASCNTVTERGLQPASRFKSTKGIKPTARLVIGVEAACAAKSCHAILQAPID